MKRRQDLCRKRPQQPASSGQPAEAAAHCQEGTGRRWSGHVHPPRKPQLHCAGQRPLTPALMGLAVRLSQDHPGHGVLCSRWNRGYWGPESPPAQHLSTRVPWTQGTGLGKTVPRGVPAQLVPGSSGLTAQPRSGCSGRGPVGALGWAAPLGHGWWPLVCWPGMGRPAEGRGGLGLPGWRSWHGAAAGVPWLAWPPQASLDA